MRKVTLGSDQRIGSGNKMKVEIGGFNRSTHDLGYVFRSTISAGTLVPFMNKTALPGDIWDIDLGCEIITPPTLGPLFGSFKVQLDMYVMPMRLMVGPMYMNRQGMGLRMSEVLIPQIEVGGVSPKRGYENIDNAQIHQSCLLKYLGIAGLGYSEDEGEVVRRLFNAMPLLTYFEIYKYYYANQQQGYGVTIHRSASGTVLEIQDAEGDAPSLPSPIQIPTDPKTDTPVILPFVPNGTMRLFMSGITEANFRPEDVKMVWQQVIDGVPTGPIVRTKIYPEIFTEYEVNEIGGGVDFKKPSPNSTGLYVSRAIYLVQYLQTSPREDIEPKLVEWQLSNVDDMRGLLMAENKFGDQLIIGPSGSMIPPYGLILQEDGDNFSTTYNQEGLAIKTYQADIYQTWLNTDWIDGTDGINEVTSVDTSGGSFTINEIIVNRKIFDMLNKIGVAGNNYDAWQEAVYDHSMMREAKSPVYVGGLIKELMFQEVVSQSESGDQPLGTLAGRGQMTGKHKGGSVRIRIDEPSIIMGLVSLTPRVTYSQGNQWDVNLKSIDDLHKPDLDQIGFQNLITDQMAWWDTQIDSGTGLPIFQGVGKQPAYMNYMTEVDRTYGEFANEQSLQWMTLNRRYENVAEGGGIVIDYTTYIDPAKFNYIFADTRRDACNFWCHIGVDAQVRRVMSAKVMPQL